MAVGVAMGQILVSELYPQVYWVDLLETLCFPSQGDGFV